VEKKLSALDDVTAAVNFATGGEPAMEALSCPG
jgi:hypothetical protein